MLDRLRWAAEYSQTKANQEADARTFVAALSAEDKAELSKGLWLLGTTQPTVPPMTAVQQFVHYLDNEDRALLANELLRGV